MKKYLFLFSILFVCFFSSIPVSYALNSDIENNIQTFYNEAYEKEYPYCIYSTCDRGMMICFKEMHLSTIIAKQQQESSNRIYFTSSSDNDEAYIVLFNFSSIKEKNFSSFSSFSYTYYLTLDNIYTNFDFYYEDFSGDKKLIRSNFYFKEQKLLTFDLPENYSVELKDENNKIIEELSKNKYLIYYGNYTYSLFFDNEIVLEDQPLEFTKEITIKPIKKVIFKTPKDSSFSLKNMDGELIEETDGYYYLLVGNYYYSLSKEGFFPKENEQIKITDDATYTLVLDSKYNPNTMQSIFTQYYNYIRDLVSDIFPLDNPLFIYLITFVIGFFLIALIRKLIGGII